MSFPQDLKYSSEHEWLRIEEDDVAVLGITDFAQGELGEIVYVEVESVGDEVAKDEIFGTVEAVKTTSDLFMPVNGTVIEFNDQLNENAGDNPALVNEDPYGNGWIVKIKLNDPAELEELMDAATYEELVG